MQIAEAPTGLVNITCSYPFSLNMKPYYNGGTLCSCSICPALWPTLSTSTATKVGMFPGFSKFCLRFLLTKLWVRPCLFPIYKIECIGILVRMDDSRLLGPWKLCLIKDTSSLVDLSGLGNWILPPKVKNFLWKLMNDGMPTCARLAAKGVDVVQKCAMCGYQGEDSAHLFFECPFTCKNHQRN